MKNADEIIWNQTRDLLVCSAVPQPTVSPRARTLLVYRVTSTLLHYLKSKYVPHYLKTAKHSNCGLVPIRVDKATFASKVQQIIFLILDKSLPSYLQPY